MTGDRDDPSLRPTPARSMRALKQQGTSFAIRLTMALLVVVALGELVLIVAMLMGAWS